LKNHIISLAERVSATFLFSFIGVVLAFGTNNIDTQALKAAAIAGGLSVAKYIYAVTASYLKSTSASGGLNVVTLADAEKLINLSALVLNGAEKKAPEAPAASPVAVDPVPAPAASVPS